MRNPNMHHSLKLRNRGLLGLREYLLLVLSVAYPVAGWSQDGNLFPPGVKVLTTLETSVSAWSPDGQRLAYATDDGVWVVEAPTFQQPTQLVRKGRGGAHPIEQLRWSPDGKKLAFVSSRPGDDWVTIWLTDVDGSHLQDLLPPGAPFGSSGNRDVEISAWLNTQELAFAAHCGGACMLLSKLDVESSRYWRFCEMVEGSVSWAPTKNRAIINYHYSALSEGGLGLVDMRNSKLISADVPDGFSEECPLVLQGCSSEGDKIQGEDYGFNAWAPDGKRALYTSWACSKKPVVDSVVNLYLWDVDSNHREQLVPNAGWGAWSPDGSKIAFLLFGEPSYDSDKRILSTDFAPGKPLRIYLGILEVATKAVSTLVPLESKLLNPGNVDDWNMFRPVWAPDGKHLVIRNPQKDLVLIGADGSRHQPLTQGVHLEAYCDATCTQWSPNGKWLALLPAGKFTNLGESKGLERFLPLVGREDAALSDAEIIQRYFEQILSKGPEAYSPFLWEYISALEEIGKMEAAREQYRKAIEQVQRSEKWHDTDLEVDLKKSYAEFLCRHGQEKDAAEWGTCTTPSGWPHQEDLLQYRPALLSQRAAPWQNEAAKLQEAPTRPPEETSHVSSPQFPSLYIIEVPEKEP